VTPARDWGKWTAVPPNHGVEHLLLRWRMSAFRNIHGPLGADALVLKPIIRDELMWTVRQGLDDSKSR